MSFNGEAFLSIISPVYKAEAIVEELVTQIEKSLTTLTHSYEIILVEDNGGDNSWLKIESICAANKNVRGIKLSRNFGQHHAITAGLKNCVGQWIIVMDCDLQDNPSEIPALLNKAIEDKVDIVLAQRIARQDTFIKKLGSKIFYKVFSYLTDIEMDGSVANFGIYSRKVVDAINQLNEPFRFFPAFVNWVGFKKTFLPVNHQSRFEGKSSYNWRRLIQLAMQVIVANSNKPLRLTVQLGLLLSLSSICLAIFYLIKYLSGQIIISGFASLIISIWFIGGLTIFVLGILGLYIGKIFEGIKERPNYLIEEKLNY